MTKNNWKEKALNMAKTTNLSWRQIASEIGKSKSTVSDFLRKETKGYVKPSELKLEESHGYSTLKVLLLDIETAPILGAVWGLWQNNVGLNQIERDWSVLSWAAKWLGKDEVFYEDNRYSTNLENDEELLKGIWELLNESDIIITQNGTKFDIKKLNARFIINGFEPPSSFKHIDTLKIAKSIFGFTSNKLEYMTDKLCENHKKLKHAKFAGYELWRECLKGNQEAWEEMEAYNKMDIISMEELYYKLRPWDKKHPNFNLYREDTDIVCRCGSTHFIEDGYAYTSVSKFQRYRCVDCGAESRGRKNLFSKEKRSSLQMNIA